MEGLPVGDRTHSRARWCHPAGEQAKQRAWEVGMERDEGTGCSGEFYEDNQAMWGLAPDAESLRHTSIILQLTFAEQFVRSAWHI